MTANSPSQEPKLELVDVQEYAQKGLSKPPALAYRILIDRERKVWSHPAITGEDILALVNKSPQEWVAVQRFADGHSMAIKPDEKVDLTPPGVERFVTMRREAQDG